MSSLICEATDRFYYERIDTTEPQASLLCAAFDLVLGRFAVGGGGGGHGSSGEVILSDTYAVLGPVIGAEFPLIAEVHVTGNAIGGTDYDFCGSGSVSARLRSLESPAEVTMYVSAYGNYNDDNGFCYGETVPIDQRLQLSMQVVTGQPFSLEISARGAGSRGGSGGASGQLGFAGLAPGMSVVSCQGFSEGPVQVSASTWGRVKSLYR